MNVLMPLIYLISLKIESAYFTPKTNGCMTFFYFGHYAITLSNGTFKSNRTSKLNAAFAEGFKRQHPDPPCKNGTYSPPSIPSVFSRHRRHTP